MDAWQRSVKRKYDSLIAVESPKCRKKDDVESCDNVVFTHSLGILPKLAGNPSHHTLCKNSTDSGYEALESSLQLSELPLSHTDSALEEEIKFNNSTNNADLELALLRRAFQVEHEAYNAIYRELEEERNASAVAANEAISAIARIQEEKSAMQLEIQHYKMMAEVKGARDEEAIMILKDILMRKDDEIFNLMDEVKAYRSVLQRFELEGWRKDSCQKILSEMVGKDTGFHLLESKAESLLLSEYFDSRASSCWDDTLEDVGNRTFGRMQNMQIYQPYSGCLDFDDVGRDVANICDTAGLGWEERHQCLDVAEKSPIHKVRYANDSQGPASFIGEGMVRNLSKRRFYLSGDRESWQEESSEERGLTEEKCVLLNAEYCTQLDTNGSKVAGRKESQDKRKTIFGVGFSTSATEEQEDQYVWEHLRRLEGRIENLGEQKKQQREQLHESTHSLQNKWSVDNRELFVVGSNEVARKHWKRLKCCKNLRSHSSRISSTNTLGSSFADCGESIFQDGHYLEKFLMPGYVCQNTATHDIIPEGAFDQELLDIESEESCIEGQGEGVHDVFEVPVPHTFMRSKSFLSEESYKNDGATMDHEEYPETLSEGSVPCETGGYFPYECGTKSTLMYAKQSNSDHELGFIFDPVLQSVTHKCHTVEALDVANTQISIPGAVQQLTLRLQALETERVFMKQAIESLRKENGELKLLREIAQQLRELKGTVENPEQPKECLRWQQLSFLTFFKNLLAFGRLKFCTHPQILHRFLTNSYHPKIQKNMASGIQFGERVGLSYLLEEQPDYKMFACLTRGLKVRFPYGERAYLSQTLLKV